MRVGGIVGALAILVLAGCGGPSPSASSARSAGPGGSPPPVCALVTDFAGAFGREPVASPGNFIVEGRDRCRWIVARDPSRSVGLTLGPKTDHDATIAGLGAGETVPDLGDDARWWPSSRTLSVAVGDRSVQVDLQVDAADVRLETAVALARQAVAALGGG